MSVDLPPPGPEPLPDEAVDPNRWGQSALVITAIGILAHIGMSLMEPG